LSPSTSPSRIRRMSASATRSSDSTPAMRTALPALLLLAAAAIATPVAGAQTGASTPDSAASAPAVGTAAKAKRTKVRLRFVTRSQRALLNRGRLAVRVRSNRRTRVRLSARRGKARGLFRRRAVRLKRGRARTVRLRLTKRGRAVLRMCGPHRVVVQAAFRLRGPRSTRRLVRRARRIAGNAPNCVLHVNAPNANRCDPIDLAHCLAPYPNDYFTAADPATGTGKRVNLHPDSVPTNFNGFSTFHPELNRNDGFSPNNVIVARVPGIEGPAVFKANGLVALMDIGAYDDPGQRVVLIDADTGERQPIWAEVDMVPGTPNPHAGGQVQGTANDRLLLIHPAVALDYGKRYIVALRSLTNAAGTPLQPNSVFRAYRDGRPTDSAAVEARRSKMEGIFSKLSGAGIARQDLYLAWDFTVASEQNLTQRLVAMRDDAFAELGDLDLADGEVDGDAPGIDNVEETYYELCDSDGDPDVCELNSDTPESNYAFKKVTGTIEVPCYMDAPGATYNPEQPNLPCAPGSRLHYAAGAEAPSQNGEATWAAPFTCVLPRVTNEAEEMGTGRPGVLFGHGLLQNHRVVEQLGLFPASLEGVSCGTDWIGLSAIDPITNQQLPNGDLDYLINMIAIRANLGLFSALPDRSQQGYVNVLYLARAMAHPDGLSALPEFDEGDGSALEIDPDQTADDLGYYGVSLGGIFGGATTSVAPDWQRAVLSVPGMGFTTLLSRSTQFNQFLPFIYAGYPDPLPRQIGMSILQLAWDRGEPSGYVHGITDGRFGTPPHQVMIHEAFGDHQVTNVQTETLARSLGAAVRTPTVAPARLIDRTCPVPGVAGPYCFSDSVEPFYTPAQELIDSDDLNQVGGYAGGDAVAYTLDTGAIGTEDDEIVGTTPNPDWKIAPLGAIGLTPNDGLDPHEPGATSPAAQQVAIPFLLGQGYYDACVSGAPGPLDMPPWSVPYGGAPGDPCTAPPVHSPGQGQ
jgi:hypothetical protein